MCGAGVQAPGGWARLRAAGEGQAEAAWTDLAGAGQGGAAGRPVVELATRDCVLCGDGLHGDVR